MRREPASVLAALASMVPGWCVSIFGDSQTQYMTLILFVALPFYCMFVVTVLAIVPTIVRWLGLSSMRAYIVSGCFAALLLGMALIEGGVDWAGGAAAAVSSLSAFLLVPFFEKMGQTSSSQ